MEVYLLQLQSLIDTIDLNKLALKEKIQKEVYRFKRFQSKLLKNTTPIILKDIDVRDYVKFILGEGEIEEKRNAELCAMEDDNKRQ